MLDHAPAQHSRELTARQMGVFQRILEVRQRQSGEFSVIGINRVITGERVVRLFNKNAYPLMDGQAHNKSPVINSSAVPLFFKRRLRRLIRKFPSLKAVILLLNQPYFDFL